MKTITGWAAVMVAVITMASCGGDSNLSHTEFVDAANRLCGDYSTKQARIEKDYLAATDQGEKGRLGGELATVTSSFVADLMNLKASDPVDRSIQDLLREGSDLAKQRGQNPTNGVLDQKIVATNANLIAAFTDAGIAECATAAS